MRNLRTSVVGNLKVISTIFSSIVQVGDNVSVTPKSNVLAVQRQDSSYRENEGNFGQFPVFQRPIPEISLTEGIHLNIHHAVPEIRVGSIKILGLSTASVLQVGSNLLTGPESRIKHIRQLAPADARKREGNP